MVIDFFGMDGNSKKLTKNGYKDDDVKDATDSQELDIQECQFYRMLAARLNFIAQNNPAIQYSAKEICRNTVRLERAHFEKIKKLARFLLGVKTVEWEYPWQEEQEAVKVQVFSGSDWAGCLRTRRSTSGGLVTVGWHPFRTWSSTQKVVATSSAGCTALRKECREDWACSQCFVRWGSTQDWNCQQTLRPPRRLHLPEGLDVCAIWR